MKTHAQSMIQKQQADDRGRCRYLTVFEHPLCIRVEPMVPILGSGRLTVSAPDGTSLQTIQRMMVAHGLGDHYDAWLRCSGSTHLKRGRLTDEV